MDDLYEPSSSFLVQVANGDVPLTGSEFAVRNLRRVIEFMRDADVANRDWATMLVAMQEIDTPEVREALLAATTDGDAVVRGEGLCGLANRDKNLAKSLIADELLKDDCEYATFDAAEVVGDPSFVPALRNWLGRVELEHVKNQLKAAIAACEMSAQRRD